MIFDTLAGALGIPAAALEGGAVTLLAIALIGFARILLKKENEDIIQLGFSQQLVTLTSSAVEESRKLREAYESNVLAITHISDVLTSLKAAFDSMATDVVEQMDKVGKQFGGLSAEVDKVVNPIESALKTIHRDLIRNAETTILVHNPDGKPIATLKVYPEIHPETGDFTLHVEYKEETNG